MNDWIELAEVRGDGLVFAPHLRELGVKRSQLAEALRRGILYAVRPGVYARPPAPTSEGRALRHRNLVRALVAVAPGHVVSHFSAAAIHGLPIIGAWPARVDVLDFRARGGSSRPGFAAHRSLVEPPAELVDGVAVTTLERTLVDLAATSTLLVATTALDSALHDGRTTRELLAEELELVAPRYGRRRAEEVIQFADGRSATPGESLSRVRTHQLDFEARELQIHVSTWLGEHDVDFGWESAALFGEFDGFGKYSREEYLKGETSAQAVVREKAREDAIRAKTKRAFVRWGWADALSPRRFERILREGGVPSRRGARKVSRSLK